MTKPVHAHASIDELFPDFSDHFQINDSITLSTKEDAVYRGRIIKIGRDTITLFLSPDGPTHEYQRARIAAVRRNKPLAAESPEQS